MGETAGRRRGRQPSGGRRRGFPCRITDNRRARSRLGALETSRPSTRIAPEVGLMRRLVSESSVDFPAPLGPTMPITPAARNGEADIVYDHRFAVALADLVDFDHRRPALNRMRRNVMPPTKSDDDGQRRAEAETVVRAASGLRRASRRQARPQPAERWHVGPKAPADRPGWRPAGRRTWLARPAPSTPTPGRRRPRRRWPTGAPCRRRGRLPGRVPERARRVRQDGEAR